MTNLVPPEHIEEIVGIGRHPSVHYGRLVSPERSYDPAASATFYILHSGHCRDSGIDLRECSFSVALDRGVDTDVWAGHENVAVELSVVDGKLLPVERSSIETWRDRAGRRQAQVLGDEHKDRSVWINTGGEVWAWVQEDWRQLRDSGLWSGMGMYSGEAIMRRRGPYTEIDFVKIDPVMGDGIAGR